MQTISVGTKCVRIAGRKAGSKVTVSKVVDMNFVMVKDESGKEKRCNVKHLEPL